MKAPARSSLPAGALVRTGLLAILFLGLTWLCFRRWASDVLFGDDLANYGAYLNGQYLHSWGQALFGGFADKYRPVDSVAMKVMFDLFGPNMRPARYADMALNVVCGLLVERIAYAVSGRRLAISILAGIMTVTSRFLLYQATELTSMVEAIGYVLFLTMLAAVVAVHSAPLGERGPNLRPTVIAVVAYWLLVLDHERYLIVAPWLAVALWADPERRESRLWTRAWPALAVLAAVVFNIVYKMMLLHQGVMVGTGGSHLSVNAADTLDHASQALASLFAFNHGPAYLVGRDLSAAPYDWVTFAAAAFVFFFVLLMVFGLAARASDPDPDKSGARGPLLPMALAVLAALLLIPPLLTIRMEQRWLVEPFALLVLMGAWAAGQVHDLNRAIRLFLTWAVASIAVDFGLSAGFGPIFFVSSGRAAEAVKHDVIDSLPPGTGALLIGSEDLCSWGLQNGAFFKLYATGRGPFSCVNDVKKIDSAALATGQAIYRIRSNAPAQEVTGLVVGDRAYEAETRRIEFISRFDQGQINDPKPMESPSGKGVTLIDQDTGTEVRRSMAVITGFSYRFDHIPVQADDRLEFEAAMAFPTKGPGRARVIVTGADGKPVEVFSQLLPFRTKAGPPSIVRASIPLARFGSEISVTFAADTPKGVDSSAQWVVYMRPRIAAPSRQP